VERLMTGGRDIAVSLDAASQLAHVEICRPPANYFDTSLLAALADAMHELEADGLCRAIVLSARGRHFSAGANLHDMAADEDVELLYSEAVRLFEVGLPIVAAVQGAAVGGGLGLALVADFRIATPGTRFVCPFARLGLHHGFGLTVTLPRVIGFQRATELLYTGGELHGPAALASGLCDRLVTEDQLLETAAGLADVIAHAGPLAVRAIRRTMRADLANQVRQATRHEWAEQQALGRTKDFAEGVSASAERRSPTFSGE
jgi:2-(1,2-epoxy-1,2-dihydrophenyl)acetyl-CoA isomerase